MNEHIVTLVQVSDHEVCVYASHKDADSLHAHLVERGIAVTVPTGKTAAVRTIGSDAGHKVVTSTKHAIPFAARAPSAEVGAIVEEWIQSHHPDFS